jgi:hypothetical protein
MGLLAVLLLAALGCQAQDIDLRLTPAYQVVGSSLYLTHAGDGSGRLFIVRQGGDILVVRDGQVL